MKDDHPFFRELAGIQHTQDLWRNALIADSFATICNEPEVTYRTKGSYLSALHRMGYLNICGAEISPKGIVIRVAFNNNQMPVLFHEIDQDVQDAVAPSISLQLLKKHQGGQGELENF